MPALASFDAERRVAVAYMVAGIKAGELAARPVAAGRGRGCVPSPSMRPALARLDAGPQPGRGCAAAARWYGTARRVAARILAHPGAFAYMVASLDAVAGVAFDAA